MQIDFEFSGGYANLSAEYHANTDELQEDISEELKQLVKNSGLLRYNQQDEETLLPGPPDAIVYHLKLQDNDESISLSFTDMTIPSKAHPLFTRLRSLALKETAKRRRSMRHKK